MWEAITHAQNGFDNWTPLRKEQKAVPFVGFVAKLKAGVLYVEANLLYKVSRALTEGASSLRPQLETWSTDQPIPAEWGEMLAGVASGPQKAIDMAIKLVQQLESRSAWFDQFAAFNSQVKAVVKEWQGVVDQTSGRLKRLKLINLLGLRLLHLVKRCAAFQAPTPRLLFEG